MTNTVTTVATNATSKVANELGAVAQESSALLQAAQQWIVEHGISFVVSLLVSLIILIIGVFIVKIITRLSRTAIEKSGKINVLLANFLVSTISKVCWVIIGMIVLKRLGIDITPLIAGLGVTGFILGFAFQESLGNLASGLMIAINQPFRVGDYVAFNAVEGSIIELNMMATTLATFDNKKIVIPNKVVWGAPITNFSVMPTRRVDLVFNVAYGSDLDRVRTIFTDLLASKSYVIKDTPPTIEVGDLQDSSVAFYVRPWVKNADYWTAFFDLKRTGKQALDAAGIEIPFPQVVVHQSK